MRSPVLSPRRGVVSRLVALLFAFAGIAAQAPAQQSQDGHALGLRRPTGDEQAWMDANAIDTHSVRLNRMGLERVNADRREKGRSEFPMAPTVANGAEPSPSIEANAVAATESSATPENGPTFEADGAVLPASVDNSTLAAFPPVRDQGGLSSCAAFSSTYYVGTHMTGLARGWSNGDTTNTRKFSPKWTYAFANGGNDSGTWFSTVFDVLLKLGAATWSDWSYSGTTATSSYREWPRDAAVWRNAINYRFATVGRVASIHTDAGLTQAKALLTNGYLLLYGTDIDGWQFTTVSNDPATTADNAFVGQQACRFVRADSSGHAMTIVGYNDDLWIDINKNGVVDAGEKGALKVVNSWGTSWKNDGFVWIAYDALRTISQVPAAAGSDHTVNRAGVTDSYSTAFWGNEVYWITARPGYTPTLLAQFTLSSVKRNQLTLRVGRSATTATTPASYFPTSTSYSGWAQGPGLAQAFVRLGGPYAFDGTTTAVNGTFMLDCTDLVTAGAQRYYLEVADNLAGSAATVSDFKLVNPAGATIATSTNGIPLNVDAGTANAYIDYTLGNPPAITSATTLNAVAGTAFTSTITASNSPTGFTVSDLPPGLTLAASTGVISGTPLVPGTYSVSVGAINNSGTGTATLSIVVAAAPVLVPVVASATAATGTVGVPFTYTISATNTPTFFYATSLPAGFTLNSSTGAITGTPTAAGTYSISISAANYGGTGAARTLTLTIAAAPATAPVITSAGTASGASGASFTYRIEATNTPTAFAAANLPAGLTLNASTGVISGVLPVARAYDITLQASNASGSGYKSLALTVTGGSSFGPANDGFANRVPLSGSSVATSGSNVNASAETAEPAHAGNTAVKSVWYSWTAPTTGTVTINTIGSNFDTVLGVYTGTTLASLVAVASDDESGGNNTSKVTFDTTSGTIYKIAIDGKAGAEGATQLNIAFTPGAAPANDAFANRIALTGTSAAISGGNLGATAETGEPAHASNTAVKSVWWTWTAPSTGRFTVDTIGSSFDTVLAIYTGSAVNALTLVGSDDEGGGHNTSKVTFSATSGTAYQIAVDGWHGAEGAIQLNLAVAPAGPTNDNFANRATLTGATASATGSNVNASAEGGEPTHAGYAASKSIWWTWTAPSAGRVTIDTIGSGIDTLLEVYTGTSLTALTRVARDDDSGGSGTSRVAFTVTSGTTYQIAVDAYAGQEGSIKLNLALGTATAPANDNFLNRATLAGSAASASVANISATAETGEPAHARNTAAHSVWWTWIAPTSGRVTISTSGSDFDTVLAVYTGTSVSALTEISSNDQDGLLDTSAVTFFVTAGTAYQIAVDGWHGDTGTVELSLALVQTNDLYFTDFEAFASGSDTIAYNDGWLSNDITNGTSGIFKGFGGSQTAWLGFNTGSRLSSIQLWRTINYAPIVAGTPQIQMQVDLSIEDSTNGRRDAFYITMYNTSGQAICGVLFDNATQRVYRYEGTQFIATGQTFNRHTRYAFSASMNFATNTWSASLGSLTLFTDQAMTTTTRTLSIGDFTFGWIPAASTTPGDNYMVFDNYRVSLAVSNDAFASATGLSGENVWVNGTNQGATRETSEPNHAGNSGGHSVWWRWVAPGNGTATISTRGSSFDTLLGVYTGTALNALTTVASNDDESATYKTSTATFNVTSGTAYMIAVDGWGGASGTITMNVAYRPPSAPAVNAQPGNQTTGAGGTASFSITASGATAVRWQRNGGDISGGTNGTLTVDNVQPANAGLYNAVLTNGTGSTSTLPAILGVNTNQKVIGAGSEFAANIAHANGNFYDQVLLQGAAATITADPGQVTRISYVDLNNDIVQIEFAGAGTLSVVLDSSSGPAAPVNYNQASVGYMKGHAGIVITGADETTNVSVFSVGRGNAVNQALFKDDVTYDGHADIAFIAILSSNGKFGGVRTANASYFSTKGITGLYAPGVTFTGPVFVGNIDAFDAATPMLVLGSAADTRITGGDLQQANGRAVAVSGITQLKFVTGSDSHGNIQAAKTNKARLEQDGVDVTAQIVVNP